MARTGSWKRWCDSFVQYVRAEVSAGGKACVGRVDVCVVFRREARERVKWVRADLPRKLF